jgi:hypothetical protein
MQVGIDLFGRNTTGSKGVSKYVSPFEKQSCAIKSEDSCSGSRFLKMNLNPSSKNPDTTWDRIFTKPDALSESPFYD